MAKNLVIVESPTKAKTITKFLGKNYTVMASYGHVRDLPNKASEIPAKVKKEKWSRIGVNIEKGFEALYIIPPDKKKVVKKLKQEVNSAATLLLATDEDREGESISWHLLEVLKPKIETKRLVFHEITKEAIQNSLKTARDIDMRLVQAQETRRIIDRLFGYTVSPLLWKKMAPRLSAGRVQSVAMKLLVEREKERMRFKKAIYWDIKGTFKDPTSGSSFQATLVKLNGRKVASGSDFDPTTGKQKPHSKAIVLDEPETKELVSRLSSGNFEVSSVVKKPYTARPSAPFVTSTLQQEANKRFKFSVRRTMAIAQQLYENGFITYMRTDSTSLSSEGLNGAKEAILKAFGKDYLAPTERRYETKVKNAQEAHEAIRPAGAHFTPPEEVKEKMGVEAYKIYELIWKRTVASQMKDAKGTRVVVALEKNGAVFRASGKTITFEGFMKAYSTDDASAEKGEEESFLPPLEEGQSVHVSEMIPVEHTTQPPARYTEGSLIRELEKRGIGRPSTWATIVDVVLSRQYAFKKGSALVPSFVAMAVTSLLERYFTQYVDYEFTARLEDALDLIATGKANGTEYLNDFYFGNGHPGLKQLIEQGEENIDPRDVCGIALTDNGDTSGIEVRIGRYGPYITDGKTSVAVPDMLAPEDLTVAKAKELLKEAAKGPTILGKDPDTGKPVYLKKGRFGPYVQLGDLEEGASEKPKMSSLIEGMDPNEVTLEVALKLLSLPYALGTDPKTGQEVILSNGRYGPYVTCGSESRSIPLEEFSPLEITLEQALDLLSRPKRRRRRGSSTLKELGEHPATERKLLLKTGRYGPYVTDGEINA
ncbi:MAG: type I DNA topoisomerase, partial [Candidatus Dadabacteria bacterium]